MGVQVDILKPAIGAKITLDRSAIGDPVTAEELRQLLERHTVLVLPRINLTDAEQLVLTDALGERVNVARASGRENVDEVYQVTFNPGGNIEKEYVLGTFFWHMDGMTVDLAPPKATILSARQLSSSGGQTEFASTRAAYEALPAEDKAIYAELQVLHTVTASVREILPAEAVHEARRAMRHVHPLVSRRPDGTRSLIIGSTADIVIGKSQAESRALFARLVEWAAQPAFTYRHDWQEGDCVIWDNTCALHRVVPYAEDSGRRMHRTTIAGLETVN